MKKKLLILVGALTLVIVLGFGIFHSNAANADPSLTHEDIRLMVKAQYPGTITEIELEKDQNKAVYEVEVENNDKKYEIKFDGNSGEVLKLEEKVFMAKGEKEFEAEVEGNVSSDDENSGNMSEAENSEDGNNNNTKSNADPETNESEDDDSSTDQNQVTQNEKENNSHETKKSKESKAETTNKAKIDIETAKSIALGEFPGTVTEVELDEDDGRLLYEIEIETLTGEADFEIDAYTGEILVISIDHDDDD
ncbi:Peptidase propeptide and YPEB domain-containing protein [Oceanobacillus limi]|uniref:Peptidase propeptide and YPEB domain-containing protein n=1 Tax=Oceanobacillus limi TaxID=930131 RepID=A0A1I0AQT7_9BACI|nr:PepSY domain-containing protein [Oceanobacillus limi]SES96754.1 Peptidase propeptide and YPEB domain-containing protein [Oceanobacillus limi]